MPSGVPRSPYLPASQSPGASPGLLLSLYAASGAAALIYEVGWTRLLTLQLGHTVAATSSVLAAFMGGLALGAWIAGKSLRRDDTGRTSARARSALWTYAALEIVVAIAALLLPLALRAAVPVLAWAYADGSAPLRFSSIRVAISLVLLGVPATAMGATFPIAASWRRRSRSTVLQWARKSAEAAEPTSTSSRSRVATISRVRHSRASQGLATGVISRAAT
jgi:spermidine synthase